jgi:hypothetical protein
VNETLYAAVGPLLHESCPYRIEVLSQASGEAAHRGGAGLLGIKVQLPCLYPESTTLIGSGPGLCELRRIWIRRTAQNSVNAKFAEIV